MGAGAILADHSALVDDRDGSAVAQLRRMAADAWAAAKTQEAIDRDVKRVRFLRLLERGAGVALYYAVDDARVSGVSWVGSVGC